MSDSMTPGDMLWMEATRDVEAEHEAGLLAAASVQAAPLFAMVLAAESVDDFHNRVALVDNSLRATASVVAKEGTPDHTFVLAALPQQWFADWQLAFEARQNEGKTAAREDYEHWNEDADRVWWEEEGRHGDDSGTYYCDVCGYEHGGLCPMEGSRKTAAMSYVQIPENIGGGQVEVHVSDPGALPSFAIINWPGWAEKAVRDRVRLSMGDDYPIRRITVNIAPGRSPREISEDWLVSAIVQGLTSKTASRKSAYTVSGYEIKAPGEDWVKLDTDDYDEVEAAVKAIGGARNRPSTIVHVKNLFNNTITVYDVSNFQGGSINSIWSYEKFYGFPYTESRKTAATYEDYAGSMQADGMTPMSKSDWESAKAREKAESDRWKDQVHPSVASKHASGPNDGEQRRYNDVGREVEDYEDKFGPDDAYDAWKDDYEDDSWYREASSGSDEPPFIQKCREVVETSGYSEFEGILVDLFTASTVVQVWDALNDANKARLGAMSPTQLVDIVFKLVNKVSSKVAEFETGWVDKTLCQACDGSGRDENFDICKTCGGHGYIYSQDKTAAVGPNGFWCRYCGDYQSIRSSSDQRAMEAHMQAHKDAGHDPQTDYDGLTPDRTKNRLSSKHAGFDAHCETCGDPLVNMDGRGWVHRPEFGDKGHAPVVKQANTSFPPKDNPEDQTAVEDRAPAAPGAPQQAQDPLVDVATAQKGGIIMEPGENGTVNAYTITDVQDSGDSMLLTVTKNGGEEMQLQVPKTEKLQIHQPASPTESKPEEVQPPQAEETEEKPFPPKSVKTAADPKSLSKGDRVWWIGVDDNIVKGTYVGPSESGTASGFTQSDAVEVDVDGGSKVNVGAQDLIKGEPPSQVAASIKTAAVNCPNCGQDITDEVTIWQGPAGGSTPSDGAIMTAQCPNCGWSGTKRKAKKVIANPYLEDGSPYGDDQNPYSSENAQRSVSQPSAEPDPGVATPSVEEDGEDED